MLRFGVVSSVDSSNGSAKVAFEDRDSIVSYDLPVFKKAWPIEPGETVACIFGKDPADGLVLGDFYTEDDPPPQTGG